MNSLNSTCRYQQRGAFSIIAAVMLLPLLAFMALVVDGGRLYMEKRLLQKAADTAALEAVARHGDCDPSSSREAELYVQDNLSRSGLVTDSVAVRCVEVGRSSGGVVREVLTPDGESIETSKTVEVTLVKTTRATPLQCLFANCTTTLQATAVAGRGQELAVFTVGSKLAEISPTGSALGPLLQGIGLNLDNTSLAGYNGLADVKITPSGLLTALGLPPTADMTVGSVNSLIEGGGIQLGHLLDAAVRAADRNDLLGTNLQLLNSLAATLNVPQLNAYIPLFREGDDKPGIFVLASTDADTAIGSVLGVDVGVLDIITSAIGIATSNHALETGLRLNLLGLANVDLKLGLIEPPSIGIGGVGTTAHTAQLRAFVHVSTDGSVIGFLLNLLNITLDLPIIVDLITAQGEIIELCSTELVEDDKDHAKIEVTGSVAQICLGELYDPNDLFSRKNACTRPDLYKSGHVFINALDLIKLEGKLVPLEALPLTTVQMTLAESETGSTGNELLLGDTVANLVDTLIALLLGQATTSGTDAQTPRILAQELWDNSLPAECTGNKQQRADCHGDKMADIQANLSPEKNPGLGLIGNLLGGLLTLVGDLVDVIFGNGCTGGLLWFGSISEDVCINQLTQGLSTPPETAPGSNSALALLLHAVSNLLTPALNAVGSLLTDLLQDLLGLELGVVDIHVQELSCGGEPQLLL